MNLSGSFEPEDFIYNTTHMIMEDEQETLDFWTTVRLHTYNPIFHCLEMFSIGLECATAAQTLVSLYIIVGVPTMHVTSREGGILQYPTPSLFHQNNDMYS